MRAMVYESRQRPHTLREQAGFTTIELLVVVAILGVLAALAAPSFTLLIERWRVRQAATELESTIQFARTEALRRGGRVGLQRSAPSGDCLTAASQWDCGWFVFLDSDNSGGAWNSGDEILRITPQPRGVRVQHFPGNSFIRFNTWGEAGLGARRFVVQSARLSNAAASVLCISSGGRIAQHHGAITCPSS